MYLKSHDEKILPGVYNFVQRFGLDLKFACKVFGLPILLSLIVFLNLQFRSSFRHFGDVIFHFPVLNVIFKKISF